MAGFESGELLRCCGSETPFRSLTFHMPSPTTLLERSELVVRASRIVAAFLQFSKCRPPSRVFRGPSAFTLVTAIPSGLVTTSCGLLIGTFLISLRENHLLSK